MTIVRSFVTAAALVLALGVGTGCVVEVRDEGNTGGSTTSASTGSGTLEVQNDTSTAIFKIRFSRVDDPSWGEDKLGVAEVVMPGERRGWAVPAGAYHVKIEFEDGRALDSLEEYDVQAGGSTVCNVHTN